VSDRLIPTVRTIVTLRDYARAVVRAWHKVGEGVPDKASVAVLWAQYMIETGGRDSWGWNIGNTKEIPNDGINYHALRGVWEGATPAEAARLIASGEAVADPSPDHARAVGVGRASVIYQPPHPATWFSSFESLDQAMEHHLVFLARRFAPAWPAVLAGDPSKFAHALRARGYFTASAEAYAAGMRRPYENFLMSSGYEDALAALEADATPTLPAMENPPSEPEPIEQATIHAMPDMLDAWRRRDE
jgi:hypothetical protein